MKKRLSAVLATAVMRCGMLFLSGYSSAQYSDMPDSDGPATGNKPSAAPLPPMVISR